MRVMLRSGAGRVGVALLPDHSCRNELASGSLIHVFPQWQTKDVSFNWVLLDSDLAALYQVETKALTRTVRRNAERFPGDFMFQLAAEESGSLVAVGAGERVAQQRPFPGNQQESIEPKGMVFGRGSPATRRTESASQSSSSLEDKYSGARHRPLHSFEARIDAFLDE
jgi:hypothetical protein